MDNNRKNNSMAPKPGRFQIFFFISSLLIISALIFAAPGSQISAAAAPFAQTPPPNFTIAFIGDQGMGSDAKAVLNLIKSEGADMVLHQGDLAYSSKVDDWDQMITDILGPAFPYFASVGNHDDGNWDRYQQVLTKRLNLIPDATCSGDYGVNSACTYKGFSFILSGVGVSGSKHVEFINQTFSNDDSIWRICSWHKNMHKMQAGGKSDATGWGVYEACRDWGAIVATGHEHSYSRTYLMSSFKNQTVVNQSSTLQLEKGKSFVFVSGLGGASIRDQENDWPWMASVYTSTQNANDGALFCHFNDNGNPNHASCYFKDVKGVIPDQFELVSLLQGGAPSTTFVDVPSDHWAYQYIETLYQQGYVAGCSTTPLMYCPEQTMTRAESAVFVERGIWGATYLPPQPKQMVFADVPLAEWFSKWADGLWSDGYTAGCGTDPLVFCPLQQHSMAEGAVFYLRILNGADYLPPSATGIFSDVATSEWYAGWVEAAYAAGIYQACETDQTLKACPNAPLTRAMGAFMMIQSKGISTQ